MGKKIVGAVLIIALLLSIVGCGGNQGTDSTFDAENLSKELSYQGPMEISYAEGFEVDFYEGGYSLIRICDGSSFLLIPEGKSAPSDLPSTVTCLYQPLENIYLVASAAMDMYASIDGLDSIRFSALAEDSWYVEEAKEAMQRGDILYAGKYSAPDYELIVSGNCDLAFENLMILHTPEVKEQLEKSGIPVIIDHSSNEDSPLGRMEWVKLCGLLTGRLEDAELVFADQEDLINQVQEKEKSDKSVAFFYITSNGAVNIRKPQDYIPKMIDMAGGRYIFQTVEKEENGSNSTMVMQMEYFYANAKDADYLIYNSAIDGELKSLDDFVQKSPLLSDFKAVKEGKVYCTSKNLYQSSMDLGTMIADINYMMSGEEEKMTYIYRLK